MSSSFDVLFKILLIGDMDDTFESAHKTTIGVDFKVRSVRMNEKTVKLQIWDTAGQERFRTITNSYYKGAHGIILCYDVTKKGSFQNLSSWYEDVCNYADENVAVIIVGTKIDLVDQREVTKEQGEYLAAKLKCPFVETSSMDSINVDKMFLDLLDVIWYGSTGISIPENLQKKAPDFVMKMTAIQEYDNTSKENVEMIYRFPILDSFPTELKCEFYDPKTKKTETIFGKVGKKEQIQEKYDDVVASGNTAVMLERDRSSVFTLQIGNINPGIIVKVFIVTVQELLFEINENGNVNLKVHLTAMDEHINHSKSFDKVVSVNARVNVSGTIVKVKCNEKIKEEKISPHERMITTKNLLTTGNTFELETEVKDYPDFVFTVEKMKIKFNEELEYCGCLSFVIDPQKLGVEKAYVEKFSLIIIVDCSGSMSGSRMKVTKNALKLLIQSLDCNRSEILINIIRFGSSQRSMFPNPKKLDKTSFTTTMKFVQDLDSNMDGEDSNSNRIIDKVKSDGVGVRFFTFTIGDNVNPFLCDELAKISNGRSCTIKKLSEINSKVISQVHQITTGNPISDIEVKFDGNKCEKNVMKRGFLGRGWTQYVFLEKFPEKSSITFTAGNKSFENSLKPKVCENNSGIGTLAVQQRINRMENEEKPNREGIAKLAIQFNVVSSETSMLLEKENNEKVDGDIVMERVQTAKVRNYSGGRDAPRSSKNSCCSAPELPTFNNPFKKNPKPEKKKQVYNEPKIEEKEEIMEKKEKPKVKANTPDEKLTELLLMQTFEGLWECESEIIDLIEKRFSIDDVKAKFEGDSSDINFWMTAIVVVYIRKTKENKKDEWIFIVEKAENMLKTQKKEEFIKKAETFVSCY